MILSVRFILKPFVVDFVTINNPGSLCWIIQGFNSLECTPPRDLTEACSFRCPTGYCTPPETTSQTIPETILSKHGALVIKVD